MKFPVVVGIALALAGCGKGSSKSDDKGGDKPGDKPAAAAKGDLHFDMTVDGKPMTIAVADVSSSYNDSGKTPTFKIFAGADGAAGVTLTVNKPMTGPSSTPSGSPVIEEEISQGSVALQNIPEKGYTTNSFNTTYPEMSVVVPDAVVITEITADGKDAKFVAGTFSAKTFGSHSKDNKDAKDTDHEVKGSFRIRHEMTGSRF